jgi:hypothetical protein
MGQKQRVLLLSSEMIRLATASSRYKKIPRLLDYSFNRVHRATQGA